MANTQAFCSSAKVDMMSGDIDLANDTVDAALYLATATINAATAAYTATGEVSGTNYSAGGVSVTNGTPPALDGTTSWWQPSASIVYTNVTLATAFDAVLLYDQTAAGDPAISVHTFGSQTVTAGDFTLTMPTGDGTTGLVRIA